MSRSRIHFYWSREHQFDRDFRSGVCLHGHTWHSREKMTIIPYYIRPVPIINRMVERELASYRQDWGHDLDFSQIFLRPPLTPALAFGVESGQIEKRLDLRPIVSITDHDDIDAHYDGGPEDRRRFPISVEWTVPFGPTHFHLGIHNLPPDRAESIFQEMRSLTQSPPDEDRAAERLAWLDEMKDVLIIYNHPLWNQTPKIGDAYGIENQIHRQAVRRFIGRCGQWLHAFELNGTRGWSENRGVMDLAEEFDFPLISGGDRHGCEPGAALNLTRSETFAEFAEEIRNGYSDLLMMPQLREPIRLRLFQIVFDFIDYHPQLPEERRFWSQRIFIHWKGKRRNFSEIWNRYDKPRSVRLFERVALTLTNSWLVPVWRTVLWERHSVPSKKEVIQSPIQYKNQASFTAASASQSAA